MDAMERGLALAMVRETKVEAMRIAEQLDVYAITRPQLAADVKVLASSVDALCAVLKAILAPTEQTREVAELLSENRPTTGLSDIEVTG